MEWAAAKKFVIVLLVMINACLFYLNISQRKEHTLSPEQQNAIISVLSQHNITVQQDLSLSCEPMPRLICKLPNYTKEQLEEVFFSGAKTTVTPTQQKITYQNEKGTLILQDAYGEMHYTHIVQQKGTLTEQSAFQKSQEYIQQIEPLFGELILTSMIEQEMGYQISYCGTYQETLVFSNVVDIFVSEQGIYAVEFCYYPIESKSQEQNDLFFVDEALLTFLREVQNTKLEITEILLGYDMISENSTTTTQSLYAVPCYHIYTETQSEPFVINAYTCQMVSKPTSNILQ